MKNLQFNAFTRQQDGAGYCSEVETFAENMVEGDANDATIIYPGKGKWISWRAENWRFSDNDFAIELPYNIYKLVSVKLNPVGCKVQYYRQSAGRHEELNWHDFKDANGNAFYPDITKYVVSETEHNALKIANYQQDITIGAIWQQNTLIYKDNIIKFPNRTYYVNGQNQSAYVLFSRLIQRFEGANNYFANSEYGGQVVLSDMQYSDPNTLKWQFQIEYIPVSPSIKMKAHKAEKMPVKYAQIVNQRAEVNNADAFGKYLHTTAQKTGTEKLSIAKTYTKIADVPPIGSVVWHKGEKYRLMANTWTITNPVVFTVTHLLSKNWSSKSKHIAVDQKYRNWNIPFDDYVWRTVYYEEFVELTGNSAAQGAYNSGFAQDLWRDAIKAQFSLGETNLAMQNMWLIKRDSNNNGETGCVLPVSTQGIGKSLVFSATTKDTLSAGLRVNPDDTEYCEEVLYCNADGTLDYMLVNLAPSINAYDMNAYPYGTLYGTNRPPLYNDTRHHFTQTFALDKDPGEAIKVTVQLHFIPTENWIVVGNKMAQDHPFVSNKPRAGFKIWRLKEYIRDGVDKIVVNVSDNGNNYLTLDTDAAVSAFIKCDGKSVRIAVDTDGYKAWAITDLDDNLYLGSNDVTKKEIFINLTRSR